MPIKEVMPRNGIRNYFFETYRRTTPGRGELDYGMVRARSAFEALDRKVGERPADLVAANIFEIVDGARGKVVALYRVHRNGTVEKQVSSK